jgi:hypothetical protein
VIPSDYKCIYSRLQVKERPNKKRYYRQHDISSEAGDHYAGYRANGSGRLSTIQGNH